ncbi:AAA domain-containing protein [Streptomyces sp. NBC_00872]|uniref:AAA domain-containing protein n=1 Tax=Streptomyces sp. NBC_00872 TaxID=2903686 RepID=UPI00386C74C9|nr:AAA domain-containing protein [Streptomyces sp. NBC_00872]
MEQLVQAVDEVLAGEGRIGGRAESPRHTRVGDVHHLEDGWYGLPTYASRIDPDDLQDMRLATGAGPDDRRGRSFTVLGWRVESERVRLQVAAHAPRSGLALWAVRRPPDFLLRSLREALAALPDTGLAERLVGGRIDAVAPAEASACGGVLKGGQAQAYLACTSPGLRLVWGPPGTGKTTVLTRALSDLALRGKRVLLVSGTNVAVDNALEGVLKGRSSLPPGLMVRVGSPALRHVAEDPRVSLPLLVRARVAEAERAVEGIAEQLASLASEPTLTELRETETRLAGFDPDTYEQAKTRLAHGVLVERLATELEAAEAGEADARIRSGHASREHQGARGRWESWARQRALLEQVAQWLSEIEKGEESLRQLRAALIDAEAALAALDTEERGLDGRGRLRTRRRRGEIQRERAEQIQRRVALQQQVVHAAQTYSAHHDVLRRRIARAQAEAHPVDETALRLQRALIDSTAMAQAKVDRDLTLAQQTAEAAGHRLRTAQQDHRPQPGDADLVATSDRAGLPRLAVRLRALQASCAGLLSRQGELEREHERLVRELARRRSQAEPELIRGASVVATTLARLRLNRTVAEGPYDVVLVDEAGAALLPELIVAVAKAKETVVLFGDFCQLGPVMPKRVPKQPELERWIRMDCFELVGIRTPADALSHPGCAALLTTHRFGPDTTDLVNRIAYGGTLRSARPVRDRALDPEIILVTTDGLGEGDDGIAAVRRAPGGTGRWWVAGSLLATALAERHHDEGESVGIVTPYKVQAQVTHDWLHDQGRLFRTPVVEVGTAHRFQGREFDVVILDLVEDGVLPGWAAAGDFKDARPFPRDGARLFNVGATRARQRVYVLAAWDALARAASGTVLAQLRDMARTEPEALVRGVRSDQLLGLSAGESPGLNPLQQEIWQAFEGHVRYSAIHDEDTYFPDALDAIDQARHSIWLWSPWYTKRMWEVLPRLHDARRRGVRIHLFVTNESDSLLQRQLANPATAADAARRLPELKAVADTVVEIKDMHQKILVIDEQLCFLGSLNTLSHAAGGRGRREIMVPFRGRRFARHILDHENADLLLHPPICPDHGAQAELRKYTIPFKQRPARSRQTTSHPAQRYFVWACPARTTAVGPDGTTSTAGCNRRKALRPDEAGYLGNQPPL